MPALPKGDDALPRECPEHAGHLGPSPIAASTDTFASEGKCW